MFTFHPLFLCFSVSLFQVFWRTRSSDDSSVSFYSNVTTNYTASDLDINKVTNGSITFIGDDNNIDVNTPNLTLGNELTFTVDVYNDDHFEYPDEIFGVELYDIAYDTTGAGNKKNTPLAT